MKNKILAVCAAAVLLLAPATAMAKTHFSFSINLFDCIPRLFVPPPPPPVVQHVIVPCPPPPYPYMERRTIVKEYYFHSPMCECPNCCETIQPHYPRFR